MKKILTLLMISFLYLSTFSMVIPQVKATSLEVNVFDESGFHPASLHGALRLEGIPIKVYTLEDILVASGFSDSNGKAYFSLDEGIYKIIYGGKITGETGGGGLGVSSKIIDVSGSSISTDLYCFRVTFHSYEAGGPYELNYIDLDKNSDGYQDKITVRPGQEVNAEFSWWELETVNVPIWYVSAFGSWNPTSALGNLASGTASPTTHVLHTVALTFTAPSEPGTYKVRLVGVLDYDWPNSYYTGDHYQPSLGRDTGIAIISKAINGPYGEGTIIVSGEAPSVSISAQYTSFVNAFNNYKQIFGQDVVIGQTVERTLSGMINDPPAHYHWHSWEGQTYPHMDGFSIRIETVQPDYVYKIIGLGYMGGSQPSASGWVQVNLPFKIEQINYAENVTYGDGSNVRVFVNALTGRIDFSAKWYNWPALIDATAFRFTITIARPGGVLPPFDKEKTRWEASYAFDTDIQGIVMFGGRTWNASDFRSDLWTFNPSTCQWTAISASGEPSARVASSMGYNALAKNFLVFGGGTLSGEVSDTWIFQFTEANTGTWTQIPVAGPSARSGAPMVYDSKNNLFILFGGERYVYSLGDTWVFDSSTGLWLDKNPSPSPSQRCRAAMAYDEKSGKALLFGGLNKGQGKLLDDTWLYDASTNIWQKIETIRAPSPRQWPSLASDGNGAFYLFGGWRVDATGGLGQYLDDTWKFDIETMQWTQLHPSESPIAQSQDALLYVDGGKFVLINGWRDSPLGDIWFFDSNQNNWFLPFFDLIIESVDISDEAPSEGQPVTLKATIKNLGNIPADGSLTLRQNITYTSPIMKSYSLPITKKFETIPAGSSTTVEITWNATEIINAESKSLLLLLETSPYDFDLTNNEAVIERIEMDDTSKFDIGVHSYSFSNRDAIEYGKSITKAELKAYVGTLLLVLFPNWPNIFRDAISDYIVCTFADFAIKGYCYGMSTTSSKYYAGLLSKPVDKDVFQMLIGEAFPNVRSHQYEAIWIGIDFSLRTLFEVNWEKIYQIIVELLNRGQPPILVMDLASGERHAVVVYNVYSVSEDIKHLVVYDNEYPGIGIIYVLDLKNNKLYSPTYSIIKAMAYNPLLPSEQIVTIIEKVIQTFLSNFKRILIFQSPVNVTVTDQYGRVLSEERDEIPSATFEYYNLTQAKVFRLPLNLTYTVQISANQEGNCTITSIIPFSERAAATFVITFNLTSSTKAELRIHPEATEYVLQVDEDGNGIVDYEILPQTEFYQMSETVTHEVFVNGQTFIVVTESNSTITNLIFVKEERKITFSVSGIAGTRGSCNISIPNNLMWGEFSLYLDGRKMIKDVEYTELHNATHYEFQIIYDNDNRKIEIVSQFVIPEYPSAIFMSLFIVLMSFVIVLAITKFPRKPRINSQTHIFLHVTSPKKRS